MVFAPGNVGTVALEAAVEPYVTSEDPILSETATWALERMAERGV